MKIVVLDGYALNPGDLSWNGIAELGDLKLFDRTEHDPKKIVQAIGNAEIIFTNKTPLSAEVLEQVQNVTYIGVLATGYNVVDINAATKKGITVTNIPSYSTLSVAQMTMALLLEMCHHVGTHTDEVHKGVWSASKDFSYWNTPLVELAGKTIGIIGFGSIGRATAQLAQAFGMKVLVVATHIEPKMETATCKYADLDTLLSKSDVISLHCPLTPKTKDLINKQSISKMKSGVKIINTARGPLINEQDLADALNNDTVSGAAVDVVSQEPISIHNPLLKAKNCIITPHIAWAPKEARSRLMEIAASNLKAFLHGNAINVV